jgi:hypothetical protein
MPLLSWIPAKKLKINHLCMNINPNAIPILEENLDKLNWALLSKNPAAIPLLEKNKDKIDWYWLSGNPNAISLLEKNKDKINFNFISSNPNAINILEQNLDKIDKLYFWLSSNPAIFEIDYLKMAKMASEKTRIIFKELMKIVLHPMRIEKLLEMTGTTEFDEFDSYI